MRRMSNSTGVGWLCGSGMPITPETGRPFNLANVFAKGKISEILRQVKNGTENPAGGLRKRSEALVSGGMKTERENGEIEDRQLHQPPRGTGGWRGWEGTWVRSW